MGLDMWLSQDGEEIQYWRKANAIHKWFVDHVQGGKDDCGTYLVTREQLQELLETCNRVLTDHTLTSDLLPPQAGFFFGSEDIDEDYFCDLKETKEFLEKEVARCRPYSESVVQVTLDILLGREYRYHSSW